MRVTVTHQVSPYDQTRRQLLLPALRHKSVSVVDNTASIILDYPKKLSVFGSWFFEHFTADISRLIYTDVEIISYTVLNYILDIFWHYFAIEYY